MWFSTEVNSSHSDPANCSTVFDGGDCGKLLKPTEAAELNKHNVFYLQLQIILIRWGFHL